MNLFNDSELINEPIFERELDFGKKAIRALKKIKVQTITL